METTYIHQVSPVCGIPCGFAASLLNRYPKFTLEKPALLATVSDEDYAAAITEVNRVLEDAQLEEPIGEVPLTADLAEQRAAMAAALEAFEDLGVGVLFYMIAWDDDGVSQSTFVLRFTVTEAE
jgi:hypothetical protein